MITLLKTAARCCLGAVLALTAMAVQASSFEGMAAPTFSLPDQNGKIHTLDSFAGHWLVLYFYPKDNTPGCTTEAKNFARDYSQFTALNAEIVGISLDDVASHKDFAETVGAKFTLLSDTDKQAAKAYKVLTSFGPMDFTKRQTFVINPDGLVVKHYEDVKADSHSAQLLADLAVLQKK
ncbi:peroxiredoxin [Permianibacter sp. IMCC34836]|uniref:peroxiredoxin n=1 Tax=Permianibacter fluminis TaxID=2738515 RepID=UPI0015582D1C|nr:peroxiredoxin [Permianibacter fluminis]NQD36537.1 peroxiredoxin [Permianibacter fluminis]